MAQVWQRGRAMTVHLASAPAAPVFELTAGDSFFVTLDRRPIGPRGWIAQVQGVHEDRRGWWIQVARADDPTVSVVLHVPFDVTTDQMLAALALWQPSSADLEVIDLA